MTKIKNFIKNEAVLCIAAVCTVISAFFSPPSLDYFGYIDWRVLSLLFCLMAVVAGLKKCGFFSSVGAKMLKGQKSLGFVSLLLVWLPFFASMLITNDVSLIVFVPFAVMILGNLKDKKYLMRVVVMQTIAANLGSMATPVGNPQNLFIYSAFEPDSLEFIMTLLPVVVASFVLVTVTTYFLCKGDGQQVTFNDETHCNKLSGWLYFLLFVLCLLAVFRVVHYLIILGVVTFFLIAYDRTILLKIDYFLLLTFVCFFIFAENIGNIPQVSQFLGNLMSVSPFFTSAGASQIISNVPSAVLLAGFTDNWRALLLGTDIGGLGTVVASLASLISLKLYIKTEGAQTGKYFILFTILNFLFLAVLCVGAVLFLL